MALNSCHLDRVFPADEELNRDMIAFPVQPPLSFVGINVFSQIGDGVLLDHLSNNLSEILNPRIKPFGNNKEKAQAFIGLDMRNFIWRKMFS
jgi:hypothetical protein